jgi:hypothetical protein
MNKNLMITISVLIFAAIVGVFLFTRSGPQETTLVETGKETGGDTAIEDIHNFQNPEEVVEAFLNIFILTAPPSVDEWLFEKALSLLSGGAKTGMEDEPTSGDLAMLVGVQDIPDNGYEIGNVVYKDNVAADIEDGLAEVSVTLKYSGGDAEKVFLLSKVEDSWQIDGVE